MVDIWLISSQLVPFFAVLVVTMIEAYNDPEEINHHGSKLFVSKEEISPNKKKRNMFEFIGKCIK